MKKYIFKKFQFSSSYKNELISFIRGLSNAEIGGNRIYDGTNNHYMQNAKEIVELIFELKKYEKNKKFKFKSFLEIGYATGINNTVINKFFNFEKIVAVDIVNPSGANTDNFFANLRFKNISLICGDSTNNNTVENVKRLRNYDFIFIDWGHDYKTVKKDFENYKKLLNPGGVIALHDVRSNLVLGVPKFWKELKNKYKSSWIFKEFFDPGHMMECGIGILFKK